MPQYESQASKRGRLHGRASQLSYQASEGAEREQLRKTFLQNRQGRAKRRGPSLLEQKEKNKRKERGLNAGTMGGSRAGLMGAFFGK